VFYLAENRNQARRSLTRPPKAS